MENILMKDFKEHLKNCKKPKCSNPGCQKLLQTASKDLTWNSPYTNKLLHACSFSCKKTIEFGEMLQFRKHDSSNKDILEFFNSTIKSLAEQPGLPV